MSWACRRALGACGSYDRGFCDRLRYPSEVALVRVDPVNTALVVACISGVVALASVGLSAWTQLQVTKRQKQGRAEERRSAHQRGSKRRQALPGSPRRQEDDRQVTADGPAVLAEGSVGALCPGTLPAGTNSSSLFMPHWTNSIRTALRAMHLATTTSPGS